MTNKTSGLVASVIVGVGLVSLVPKGQVQINQYPLPELRYEEVVLPSKIDLKNEDNDGEKYQ